MNLKFNTKLLNKVIAVITVCFFTTTICMDAIAIAVTPETKVLEYKQIFNDFSLPYSYGKITKAHFAATDRVVINIQDLHCHPQVQNNISNIIELFDKKYGVTNIYLEGACGDISTKWLTENLRDNNKKEILNNILKTGRLTGAEYYSAISDKTEIIKGLEKEEPYLENLKRFGYLLEKQNEIKLILESVEKETEKIKKQYYKRSQLRLEKLLRKYEQGKISTDKHYNLLSKYTNELAIDLAKYKNISNYITLLKLQKQFNRKTVQKELTNLLSVLKQKMSYQMYSMLLLETDNLKRIDILFEYITQMLQSYNINLADNFSQLDKYFQFVKINKNINPIQLLKEQEQLVMEMNLKFCENKLQREVVFLVSFEKYLKQYLMTKVTLDDYEYYKENIEVYKMLYNKYVNNKVLTLLEPYMKETDKFYEININRNEYFAENIFNGIETNKLEEIKDGKDETNKIINNMSKSQRIDVIVTGGFHSQTVTDILKKQGVSYIVVTPNVQGEVKEAEQTYYEIAKQQKEIDFQTLATLPFSNYGKNYQIAAAIEAFPKEAEIIFGKAEFNRVKNLIEKGDIKVKEEHAKNIKKYRKELEKEIDISRILQTDDIELKDLKKIIEKIGNFIFTENVLSQEDLADITKSIVELMNNNDSNLIFNFFDKLEYTMDIVLFKIIKSSKLNKRIEKENVKTAMKKYLELTNYNFDILEELFYYTKEIGNVELNEILNILLDKDDKNNYKNKNFIEDNIYLITAVCSKYKGDDLIKVLNLLSGKYKSDKDFIINNPDKLVSIVNQQHSVEYLGKILNLFLEKDNNGNYKNREFVEQNKQFIVTICKAYKNEDVIKVLNLFFEKDEETKNFITQFTQNFNFRREANQNITILIEQQYPVNDLKEILDMVLTKKDGIYIYEKYLKEIKSYYFELFFTRYSIVSKDMFMLVLEYMSLAYSADIDIDIEFGLSRGFFRSLKTNKDVLIQEQKDKIIYALVDILEKYSKTNNVMDIKIIEMRDFLLENIKPSNLEDKQKVNLIAEILLDNFEKLPSLVKESIIKGEPFYLKRSYDEIYDEIYELMKFMIVNYGSKNKNFITEPRQKERFIKMLAACYLELEKIFESYDEIYTLDLFVKDVLALTNKQEPIGVKERQRRMERFDIGIIEKKEKILIENMWLIFNKRNLFTIKEQNIIFNNNIDKAKKIFNVISGISDFQRLNDKVKKMFVKGYITTPVTLKEYSIDTEEAEKNDIVPRKGKNPPLIRDKENAKKRNCNSAGQVAKLFVNFVADKKNNNEQNNIIFKEKTGFSIDEINNNFMSGTVKNKDAGIYERTYDKFEILEIYADDIVYAIAQIMKQQDEEQNKIGNENFNNLLKQNEIEYNFKCPLFDGPCLVPYSEILNAGYDINDCTGSLAGGAHNIEFRNKRIYIKNHLLYGYYKNGRLVQKYGCDYDDKDFHIFSLEDIPGFRIDDGNGEYEYADSEGLFFFESMDFILEEKNRMEKEKGMEEELTVYIETDISNSIYLQNIAGSVTTEEYSDNYNLLAQWEPHTLQKLDTKINFKEKINEAKIIAKRNRIIRMLSGYEYDFRSDMSKIDEEKELAKNGTEKVKAEDTKIKFKTLDYMIVDNFVKKFIKISTEYLSFYETDKKVYAVPLNKSKNEFLEIKIVEETEVNADRRFRKLTEKEFNDSFSAKTQKLSDKNMNKLVRQVNIYNESNIRFFNKGKLKKMQSVKEQEKYLSKLFKGSEIEIVNIIEKENGKRFLILKIKDGENNIYYAETEFQIYIKQNLKFELQTYTKDITNRKEISKDKKEELLNKMASVRLDVEEQVNNELKKIETIEIEVPSYDNDASLIRFLNSINDFILNMNNKQNKQNNKLIINRGQLTPKLQKWAKNNDINLMILDMKYETIRNKKNGEFLLQYRNGKIIKYEIQKNNDGVEVLTVFSKKGIDKKSNETDLITEVLHEEFSNAEFADPEYSDNEIMTDFEEKYNITKIEEEIYKFVDDNLDVSTIKENPSQTDLIKDLLSAA